MAETGFIYALTDPRIDDPVFSVRYIGMTTKRLDKRLAEHVAEARRTKAIFHRVSWLRGLANDGLCPGVVILASVNRSELAQQEISYIADYRERGATLVNSTAGGEGLLNPSDETRERIRQSKLGHTYNTGHAVSVETREKLRQANTGYQHTEAARAKMSVAGHGKKNHLGHTHTAETRERIRQKKLGVPHVWSDAARKKLSQTRFAMARVRRSENQDSLF